MPASRYVRTKQILPGSGGGGGGGPPADAFTDSFSLDIKVDDTVATPTDQEAFLIALAAADTVAAQTEAVQLGISGYAETSPTPTESNSFTMRVWLSGSAGAGTVNPGNANGENNGTLATVETALLGADTETLTSELGANIPSGVSIASAIYRGWFRSVNTLTTSSGALKLHSISALFADIEIFTNIGNLQDTNHLSGSFTYDLIANGIDTLAKLQSCQVLHQTFDLVPGVQPHVLTVDAGCLELAAAFV